MEWRIGKRVPTFGPHAVQEFLSTIGIPAPQLSLVSYGKEKPVCTEESESCWQKNRRAHLITCPFG